MAELVWREARRAAQSILDECWDQRLPVDVGAICRANGVKVYRRDMPDELSGMIVKREGHPGVNVFVDIHEPMVRQRFTLAHELGHFAERTMIADDKEYGFVEVRSEGRRNDGHYFPHEFFADEFAGALLMPESKVQEFEAEGKSDQEMAVLFDVSVAAVRRRRLVLRNHPTHDQSL